MIDILLMFTTLGNKGSTRLSLKETIVRYNHLPMALRTPVSAFFNTHNRTVRILNNAVTLKGVINLCKCMLYKYVSPQAV